MDLPNFATYRFPYLVKFTLNKLTVTTKYIHVITWIWLYEYEFVFHLHNHVSYLIHEAWFTHIWKAEKVWQHLKFHKYLVWIFFSFLVSTCIYHIRRDLKKHLTVKFNAKAYVFRSFFAHCTCTCTLIKF